MKVSLIIPLYNEEENIQPLMSRLKEFFDENDYTYEIIFVNDGSSDTTAQLLDEQAESNDCYKVIHLRRNFGQTAAIMAGIDHAGGDILVTMDGDLQNDPADIPLLIAKIEEGYSLCSGWRKDRKDNPLTRTLPSRIANMLISKISGVHLNDYGCTLKAYKREIIKEVKLYGEMHRFIPIYAYWYGAQVAEIPVHHHPRKYGTSKYGLGRIFKVILDLMVVKFLASYSQKPIYVFGGFGLINFLLSFACFGLMVYFKYWGGKTFIQTPLPQLVVLFFIMGFMSILMGFTAEIQMRTYYESQSKPAYLISRTRNVEQKD